MQCKACGKPIGKFDRRVQLDDAKPELWGDRTAGQVGRIHTLDAALLCANPDCLVAYAAERRVRELSRV